MVRKSPGPRRVFFVFITVYHRGTASKPEKGRLKGHQRASLTGGSGQPRHFVVVFDPRPEVTVVVLLPSPKNGYTSFECLEEMSSPTRSGYGKDAGCCYVVDIVLSLLLLLPDDEPRVTARPDIEDRVNELPDIRRGLVDVGDPAVKVHVSLVKEESVGVRGCNVVVVELPPLVITCS